MATTILDTDTPLISLKEAHRFIRDCMEAVGTPNPHDIAMADILTEADYRGHYSHGMNRLEMYVEDIKHGILNPKAEPEVLKQTAATAWIDGHNGLGPIVGNFCMNLAIQKAKEVGIGIVVAKGSNHYGIAGMYTMQAMKQGLVGISCTNTSPVVAPTRTDKAVVGTNPISIAAAGLDGDGFVLDMATSAVALGKIEMQRRKNLPIPDGWCAPSGALLPLGGSEISSSYKGYGLALLVEVLSGVLGGASCGPNIRMMGLYNDHRKEADFDLGQCFMAIDPKCFAPGFEERLSNLLQLLRNTEPIDPAKPVLVAGDPERLHMAAVDKAGGVRYVRDQLNSCDKYAKELNVKQLQSHEFVRIK